MASDGDIQKIKDRLSINEVVGQYVQLKKTGRNYTARCPFHKEKTPSFYVSPERGTYICFGCGEKGDIFSFVERMEGVDFGSALRELAKRAGVELHQEFTKSKDNTDKDERLRDALEAAASFFESELRKNVAAANYVETRGVSKETREHWRIGYAPASWRVLSEHLVGLGFSKSEIVDAGLAIRSEKQQEEIYDRFRGRVMFPLFDLGGKVIAFSGRFFEKMPGSREEAEPAKYVNSPETAVFKKSRVLYGLDKAKAAIRRLDCVLLVEGQFDVVLSHQSGLPIAVALSGTALTPEHLSLMGRFSKRLILALDADAAGIRAGLRSATMAYAAGFDVKVPAFEGGKDPADLARENPELLKAAVRTSKTAIEFFLDVLRAGAKDERGYKRLIEMQVLPLVAALRSEIDRDHFIQIVAGRLGVSEAAVRVEAKRRPAVASDIPAENVVQTLPPDEFTSLERQAGMLLVHFGKRNELKELLGIERIETLEEKLAPLNEQLHFSAEAMGEDEGATAAALLRSVERAALEEQMRTVRQALAHGGDVAALGKELSALKVREQKLRNQ